MGARTALVLLAAAVCGVGKHLRITHPELDTGPSGESETMTLHLPAGMWHLEVEARRSTQRFSGEAELVAGGRHEVALVPASR